MGQLRLHLRQHAGRFLQLIVTCLVLPDPGPQRRHVGFRLGQGHLELLVDRVGVGRTGLGSALLTRLDLLPLLLLQLFYHALGADHVRMLLGVALQHGVELPLQGVDAAVDLRNGDTRGSVRRLRQEHGILARQLALEGVARVLGFMQFQSRLIQGRGCLAHAGEIILAARDHRHVLELELLHPRLGLFELLLVDLNLVLDEFARGIRVLALVAHAGLDEDRHQRLDHALRLGGIGIAERQSKEIVPPGAPDGEALGQIIDQPVLFLLGLHPQIEIGHANQLLHIGATDQRAAQNPDLLIDVGLDRKAAHQRLEDRLGVHIDARRRLELVGQSHDDGGAGDANHPGDRQPQPAPLPHSAQQRRQLPNQLIHFQPPRSE